MTTTALREATSALMATRYRHRMLPAVIKASLGLVGEDWDVLGTVGPLFGHCQMPTPTGSVEARRLGQVIGRQPSQYLSLLLELHSNNKFITVSDSGGIISSAIANAGKLPQGQENVSLLQQHSSTPKSTPTSAQFTFTCDSQVPGTVQWPGNASRDDTVEQDPGMQSNGSPNNSTSNDVSQGATSRQASQSFRRTRPQLDRELKMAARHRRQIAAEKFEENPPKPEDMWICEFCEYERIFGQPPKVLIRAFEIKDRRHRREEADRKRLLEKAKAKSRKSKKPNRSLHKGSNSGQHHTDHMRSGYTDDHQASRMHLGHSHSTQSEEEYDEGLTDCCVHSQPCPEHQEGDGGGTDGQEEAVS
ncbi:uncharacterized protein MAM_03316 [Metarhizium album ARSEF 1941]|uniref:Uncharacterized protein n=1 Tax=Metarhizium album (strain ARSEF 1941) TaxID=1081103 RepID=A0A0B2WZ63_METAS|nr:uncharacterized protein MAM_03316 [Metarhizium album ARSEF 1941]KHN98854.1 hypothetical protein MAM_03316 [Metarhizium album ARSEF 1941]